MYTRPLQLTTGVNLAFSRNLNILECLENTEKLLTFQTSSRTSIVSSQVVIKCRTTGCVMPLSQIKPPILQKMELDLRDWQTCQVETGTKKQNSSQQLCCNSSSAHTVAHCSNKSTHLPSLLSLWSTEGAVEIYKVTKIESCFSSIQYKGTATHLISVSLTFFPSLQHREKEDWMKVHVNWNILCQALVSLTTNESYELHILKGAL